MTETAARADIPPFRYTAALADEIEDALAGLLGASTAPSTRRTRPGALADPDHPRAGAREAVRAGHVPVPVRRGPARRPPAGLHRHRLLRPVPADGRPQRAARDGLRRVRPARRAVRGADRHPPARHHRGATSSSTGRSCAGWAWATTRGARWRPPTSSSTAGPSGSSCRSSTRGTTRSRQGPPDRRADRRVRGAAPGRRRTAAPWAELTDDRAAHDRRRPPAGVRQRGAGQLVPGPGHGAGQRGGDRRRALRAGQLPGLQAHHEAVDDADHRVRRPAAGRPGPAGLARADQADAAQLDRPVDRRAHRLPDRRRRRSGCSPPGRTPCSARPTWCWRRSTSWSTRWCRPPGRRARGTRGPAGTRRRPRRSPPTARSRPPRPTSSGTADAKEKTGVFIGAYATNPVNGGQIPVFIADYVLAGYGTGAIMAVPGQDERDWEFAEVFDLPIIRTVQPPEGFDGKAYTGEGPAINSAAPERGIDWTAWASPTPRRRSSTWLEAQRAGAGAVTYRLRDWLFSRQRYWGEPFPIVYDETGAADRAAGVDAAGRAARGGRLLAEDVRPRRRDTRTRRRRCRGPPTGSRSSWTWATGRSATPARPT